LKSLDWGGVCKNGLQNLEPQGVRGQDIDNTRLTAVFAIAARTASALVMIYFFAVGGKVGCHSISD
jgi:hypothetical protein